MLSRLKRLGQLPLGARHAVIALGILLVVLFGGATGFMLIEGMTFTEALYMTVITISTVGFREVRELGTGGMYFTILLIITGVSTMLFFLTGVFEFILGEYFGDFWRQRKMKSGLEKLKDHYIVCGYGRVGRSVAAELAAQGKEFVVVEKDREAFDSCVDSGFLAVLGDATAGDVLKRAGVERAIGLVSALSADSDNLYVVLTTRVLNPQIIIVARADSPDSTEKLIMVGADRVISPYQAAGKRMADVLTRPGACEFLDMVTGSNLPEYRLTELAVREDSFFAGKSIRETRLREKTGVTILSVRKKGESAFNVNPSPDTVLEAGDVLILIGTGEQMEGLHASLLEGGAKDVR